MTVGRNVYVAFLLFDSGFNDGSTIIGSSRCGGYQIYDVTDSVGSSFHDP